MFHFSRRSSLPALLLAGCLVFLLSCNPSPTPPPGPAAKGTGPGGDDDRPVTMLGGSLILTWEDPDDGLSDSGLYAFSNLGAKVNLARVKLRNRSVAGPDPEFSVRRKKNQPLGISVTLAGEGQPELTYSTSNDGTNLFLRSKSGNDLHTYFKHSKFTMEQPEHEKKVTNITFTNVIVVGGVTLPTGCSTPTATSVVCDIDPNQAVRSRIVLRVCNGGGCPGTDPL